MGALLDKLYDAFYAKQIEIVLVGLENSGKTTLMGVLSHGQALETCPTTGLDVKVIQNGGVTLKCWDLGGQAQYRGEWGRYTKGCDVIIYVVDASNPETIVDSKIELHRLLEDRDLATMPILVAANKIDKEPHLHEQEIIRELNLDYIVDNPWVVVPISALRKQNVDKILEWLISQAR
mmetsp:Transcript_19450/g.32006  ORF Transcript_19450/g.32006 Transcript_19450/m.32006 type:complete len:178 (+) Transcript_19450:210-743(+)